MELDFATYFQNVNWALQNLLGALPASEAEVVDMFNCAYETDEAAEAIVHYREMAAQ